jgi:hypothetical protein
MMQCAFGYDLYIIMYDYRALFVTPCEKTAREKHQQQRISM